MSGFVFSVRESQERFASGVATIAIGAFAQSFIVSGTPRNTLLRPGARASHEWSRSR